MFVHAYVCVCILNYHAVLPFQLPGKLNEIDNNGNLTLDLALQSHLEGIAQTLVKHKVDVNGIDHSGLCLLHKAIKRGKA